MNINNVTNGLQDILINRNDYLAKMVRDALETAIKEQLSHFIGAGSYERTGERKGQRNGFYDRELKTRVGSLTLHVARDRDGEFCPTAFERYQRSEKALIFAIVQMYYQGVATRKVQKILQELCGFGISKAQVSVLVKQFDEGLNAWRMRKLLVAYKYLVIDARYEKVRENKHIVSKAFVTIIGISETGIREVIGCWVINSESYEAWLSCFRELKERGLRGVTFAVADENAGLVKAFMEVFQDVPLQRCQVHFMRNFIGKLAKSELKVGIKLLQDVFAADSIEQARELVKKVSEFLVSKKKDKVATWLEDDIEDCFAVYNLPEEHRKKMKSTNMVERFNEELKRRSRVVRIFPDVDSCLRLLGAICQETSENWCDKIYLDMAV